MTEPAEIAAVTQPKNEFVTVALSHPIRRGETLIEKINLRKPKAGDLRGGLNMTDILQCDVGALLTIIPRISNPVLIADEADNLEADDFAEIAGAIRGFFMSADQKAAVERYIEAQSLKT